ncbi:MAG: 5-dehydro-2-deoxygluconokinase [Bacteroidota bacterium]|nr:5-dehydro-2-deoxygluconokinase [Bacteroidota bacterium]
MKYDLLAMGRSSIDLYSNDVGAPFPAITSFAAYVGGSPTNISVGAQRLGLKTALLTAVGEDPVGDFILEFLRIEQVDTRFIPRKPGRRTSAVILGIEPPDHFPLVYYRDNCADNALSIEDVLAAPLTEAKAFEFAGTNLARESSRSATLFAAERARRAGVPVLFDLDFRPDQWHDPRAFGVAARAALAHTRVAIGTEDEIKAAVLTDPDQVQVVGLQVSDAHVEGDVDAAIRTLLGLGPEVVIEKRGAEGSRIHAPDAAPVEVPGYPVKVHNILGAGDAFAAGFIYGFVKQWPLYRAARLGNACGAIVVTRHGCANFMPTLDEALVFAGERGGLT